MPVALAAIGKNKLNAERAWQMAIDFEIVER